jgi:glutathione S-transferase
MTYVDLQTARQARGLRLVVLASVPSPWSEAAKGILHVKKIQYLAVRCNVRDPEIRTWTGVHNAPVAMYDDDPPRSHWSEILALAERLDPSTPLVPRDPDQRLRHHGLIHEISSEGGLLWCGRLLQIDRSLRSEGTGGLPVPLAQHFGRKYGYAPDLAGAADQRVREVVATLAAQLRASRASGSPYLIGDSLTAADIYTATALFPFGPLPDELCPMPPHVRRMFDPVPEEIQGLLPPELIEHRELIYRRHLELPVQV